MRHPTTSYEEASVWDRAFLRSKLGQRLFVLFVACALAPLLALFVISYRSVSRELDAQAEQRLQELAKSTVMGVLARLSLLDVELQLVNHSLGATSGIRSPQVDPGRFRGVLLAGSAGDIESLSGSDFAVPLLSHAQQEQLTANQPLLHIDAPQPGEPRYLMARSLPSTSGSPTKVIWGEVEPDYLWWGTPMDNTLPAETELIVLSTESSSPLLATIAMTPDLLESLSEVVAHRSMGEFTFRHNQDDEYQAEHREVNTRPLYGLAPLTVVVAEARDLSLRPFLTFKRNLIGIVLLSLWVILLLTIAQIRRHLLPLEILKRGTQQISEGQLQTRVQVETRDELAELATSFNVMAASLETHFKTLTTSNQLVQAVLSSLNTTRIVDTVLAQIHGLLDSHRIVVALLEREETVGHLFYRDTADGKTVGPVISRISDADRALLHQQREHHFAPSETELPTYFAGDGMSRSTHSVLAFPIFLQGGLAAVVACGLHSRNRRDDLDLSSLRHVADQVAVALANAKLVEDLDALSWGTLTALGRTIDVRSHWTMGHSERVMDLAQRIGQRMGLSEKRLDSLLRGSLLHDIGKIGVPSEVLDKESSLSPAEMSRVRDHVRIGVQILRPVPALKDVLPIVAQHHERYDGAGYPAGLAGAEICLEARVLAAADCYDALRSHRPYRKALSHEAVLAYMSDQSGIQFDPDVVETLISVLTEDRESPLEAEPQASMAI